MQNRWTEMALEEAMDAIIDYRGKTPTKTTSGIPLITAKVVKDGRILPTKEFIAEEDYDVWMRRGIPQEGDVVLTTEAPLGEIAQLDGEKIALAQRIITLRGKSGVLESNFLRYLLQSHDVQHQLDSRASGTTVKGIKQSELRKVLLRFPPISEQKAIARILKALDDKIELNRRMNETLEGMAQALFKSWFVDFDPVIDNALVVGNPIPDALADRAADRRLALDNGSANRAAAAPFPATFNFIDSLGWIPEGWEVARFKQILQDYIDNRGKTPPLSDTGIPLVEVKHITDDSITPNLDTGKYVDDETYETWFRKHLETDDIVISTVGTIGRICLVPAEPKFVIAQNLLGFRFKRELASAYFMYYQMKGYRFNHDVDARLVTTVQASIKRKDLNTIDLLLPSIEIQTIFEDTVKPLIQKQSSAENENLAKLRDTILPKLISGELRIPDAEKLAAEALA